MDHLQENHSKPDILGSATDISRLPPSGTGSCHYDHEKNKIGENSLRSGISEEEMKIRREIEREIERDLEEEIKGGIYQQALRLHRLHQRRKQRRHENINRPEKNKELLEVNISIRLEEGTKIEINETKKEPPESCRPRTSRSDTAARTLVGVGSDTKRLDWVKSLRSGAAPAVAGRNVGCSRTKMPANDRYRCSHKPLRQMLSS